jgi:hypothetical protein
MNEKFDEIIEIKSERLSKLGSFTNRKDIPKYHFYDI